MSDKKTPLLYKIAKPFLKPIYKFWYNPKILGKENIPKSGSIIIVGNHIHIMDQCNIIISTKRCIHYMAKKEYFDKKYKEGKFSWFFKQTGCIPVDRSKKDEQATRSALEVLKNEEALGLFPEGTRNSLKENKIKDLYEEYYKGKEKYKDFYKKIKKNAEVCLKGTYMDSTYKGIKIEENKKLDYAYKIDKTAEILLEKEVITKQEFVNNLYYTEKFLRELMKEKRIKEDDYYNNILLPLKFGAVSLAKKTNSYIIPYAITGEYKFHSKNLTIRIGKPFKVTDDLEKSNNQLKQEIINLIKKNEIFNGK